MPPTVDLTPFGFTPTESRVYQVLLTSGPGTGYVVARQAGLARANAYSALEGLVAKGAARAEPGRPRRYRPESTEVLIGRLANEQTRSLEQLRQALAQAVIPASPTVVEINTPRGVLQLLNREVARASESVALLLPPDAYPILGPSLRRAVTAGLRLMLLATGPVELGFTQVDTVPAYPGWPGQPLIAVLDGRAALIAEREESEVSGHWSTAPTLVAAATFCIERWRIPQ